MEAHNGLSARIVEEAGFKGIWASGLALSAQFGVRDSNEASWTQVVDMLEFMAHKSIPHDAAVSEKELRAVLTKALNKGSKEEAESGEATAPDPE